MGSYEPVIIVIRAALKEPLRCTDLVFISLDSKPVWFFFAPDHNIFSLLLENGL